MLCKRKCHKQDIGEYRTVADGVQGHSSGEGGSPEVDDNPQSQLPGVNFELPGLLTSSSKVDTLRIHTQVETLIPKPQPLNPKP